MTIESAWDYLLMRGICEQALQVVTNIKGYNIESLDAIAYSEFGYSTVAQLMKDDES